MDVWNFISEPTLHPMRVKLEIFDKKGKIIGSSLEKN